MGSNIGISTRLRPLPSGWALAVWAIALVVSIPILFVGASVFAASGELWQHLAATVLGEYLRNSLLLAAGVGLGVLIIGVGCAWLASLCRFPGSRLFEWLLLLPLAAPAYLLAYTYTSLLDYFGPVQTTLRRLFGWQTLADYWFPEVGGLGGAIAMLVVVLYPYVYLLARVAFLEQSVCALEASRSLGCNPWRSFFTVALPLARPSIAAGLALALMETLGDFGTVQYFGVSTFTTGIYRTWFGLGDRPAAAQLSTVLMGFVLLLVAIERLARDRARYFQATNAYQSLPRYELGWGRSLLAMLACSLPVLLGFAIPTGYLVYLTVNNAAATIDSSFWTLSGNSLLLAAIAAAVALGFALLLAYGQRLHGSAGLLPWGVRLAAMGYAIPGTVIAVGVLLPLGSFDKALDSWMRLHFDRSTGLVLSGTIFALVFAYLVRFLALSFNTVESSLSKVRPSLDDAARGLGCSATETLLQVHMPTIGGGLLAAAMLVFVEVIKELPATLVIRPFNFDTLAVRVYQYASDERLIEAAAPALALVLVGICPVIFLSYRIARSRPGDRPNTRR